MSPWEILGVAEGRTDEREIRRAYAARVREHPPDTDPEGFRRVRDAYEWIRDGVAHLRSQEREGTAGEDPSAGPAPAPPSLGERQPRPAWVPDAPDSRAGRPDGGEESPSGPPDAALDPVTAAAALPPGRERDARLVAALRGLAERMREDRRLVPAWSAAVLEHFDPQQRPDLVASCCGTRDVVLDLMEVDGLVAQVVIRRERTVVNMLGLAQVAEMALQDAAGTHRDAGIPFAQLALQLAIVLPDAAERLLDRAFRETARKGGAESLLVEVDRRIAAGREVGVVAPEALALLAGLVEGEAWARSPASELAVQAVSSLDRSSILRRLLAENAPEFLKACQPRVRRPRRAAASPGLTYWQWRFIIFIFGAIVVAARACQPSATPWDPDRELHKNDSWEEDHQRFMEYLHREFPEAFPQDGDPQGQPPTRRER